CSFADLLLEPYADAIGPADAIIKCTVVSAAAGGRYVGWRRVEGVVERGVHLDAVRPAIGAAEVAIEHRGYAVIVHIHALNPGVDQAGRADDAGLGRQRPGALGVSRGQRGPQLG